MLKHRLKSAYYSVASFAGTGTKLKHLRQNKLVTILNLHRVSREASEYWPPLAPEVFDDLLRFLKAEFHVCDIRELATCETDRPVAVLSFDDGYRDFIEYALPLIERHEMPVNMNIVPECAITGRPIWNVRLYDYLQSASIGEINSLDIPGFSVRLGGEDPQAKMKFGVALSSYLKNRPRLERQEILSSIDSSLGNGTTRMMTTDEIRSISSRVSIGAHSYSHESMAYEDSAFFEEDFLKCKAYFESELGMPLSTYAFPNGSYRSEQIEYLRRNGIRQILLVDEKFADMSSDVLTRLTIYGETAAEARMKALGF